MSATTFTMTEIGEMKFVTTTACFGCREQTLGWYCADCWHEKYDGHSQWLKEDF